MEKQVYELPVVNITQVNMEESIAQVPISASVYLEPDWEDGGTLGIDTGTEGGDIYLY